MSSALGMDDGIMDAPILDATGGVAGGDDVGGGFDASGGAAGAARAVQMRALISTKEAAIIIGKLGKNIADIRDQSGAKVVVSENVQGAMERVLSVVGPIDAVAKAFSLVATKLVEEQQQQQQQAPGAPAMAMAGAPAALELQNRQTSIRLLVPHAHMGSIIGKQGAKIKEFQELSGSKIDAAEEMLPNSTERIVTVNGVIASIHIATYHIGNTLLAHPERASGTIFYKPIPGGAAAAASGLGGGPLGGSGAAGLGGGIRGAGSVGSGIPGGNLGYGHPGAGIQGQQGYSPYGGIGGAAGGLRGGLGGGPVGAGIGGMGVGGAAAAAAQGNQVHQQIFIPNDMVGAIIGKGGSKINEIRRASGCQVKVAEDPRDAG
ncbi:hypothetical protein HK405_001077, partial [Cladochytrium tenue]